MKPLKLFFVVTCLLAFFGTQNLFALTINDVRPTFNNSTFQGFFDTEWTNAIQSINDEIGDISDNPKKLGSAFANAGVFANHAATQRGYQGYDLFAVTVGTMFATQLPTMDFGKLGDIGDDLTNNGDVEAGIGWQIWAAQAGVNSKFLIDGLYLGFKFGYMKYDLPVDPHTSQIKYLSLGVVANYQIFNEISLMGLVVWRGLSVGSGLLYQKNNTAFIYNAEQVTEQIPYDLGGGITGTSTLILDPRVKLGLDANLVTIPVELTTAVRLLYFLNISVGFGFDINFGASDLRVTLDSTIDTTDLPAGVTQTSEGSLSTNAGAGAKPKAFAAKAMAGIGFGVGPVMVDIPVTYYFNNGLSVGVSVGFVW